MGDFLPSLRTPWWEPGQSKKVFVRHVTIWVDEVGLCDIYIRCGSKKLQNLDDISKLEDVIQVHLYLDGIFHMTGISSYAKSCGTDGISKLGDVIKVLGGWYLPLTQFWKNLLHLYDISKLSSFFFHLLLQTQVERAAEDESNPLNHMNQLTSH